MVYTLRFFPLQNGVCFVILTYLVPVLFTFYIQNVLKFKKLIPAPKVNIGQWTRTVPTPTTFLFSTQCFLQSPPVGLPLKTPDAKEMPIYSHSRVIRLFVFLHTGDASLRAEICCFVVETNVHVFQ